ncbi:host cell division inhibitor Icd-like protein [Escherichia coli]|nr:host cell division inhibitor Icd-like protein [Escherichia coli]
MIPVQKKTFSLAGMSPKSSNMTAKSGINTADASKVYHLLVVGTDALTIPEISGDDISIEKVSGCARKFLVVDDVFRSCSDSTKTFVHVRDVNEMSAMYCASGASNTEFSESIKKSLPLCGNTVYGYSAPAKSGAGRGNPNTLRATQTPKASFFVSDHYAHQISGLVRTVSMVALVGLRSRRPVSFVSGISTPANVTAISERGNSGGDSLNTKEAAIMATTPTQKPSFIWIIAAVRRDCPTITAKIHHIAAESERDARRSLVRDHVCFFAGRIRMEVAHD